MHVMLAQALSKCVGVVVHLSPVRVKRLSPAGIGTTRLAGLAYPATASAFTSLHNIKV